MQTLSKKPKYIFFQSDSTMPINMYILDAYGFTQMITIQYVLGTKWGNILWGPPRLEENYL